MAVIYATPPMLCAFVPAMAKTVSDVAALCGHRSRRLRASAFCPYLAGVYPDHALACRYARYPSYHDPIIPYPVRTGR